MSRAPVMAAVVAETSLRAAPMTTSGVAVKSHSAWTDLPAVPPLSSSRNLRSILHPAKLPSTGSAVASRELKSATAVSALATTDCSGSGTQHVSSTKSSAQVSAVVERAFDCKVRTARLTFVEARAGSSSDSMDGCQGRPASTTKGSRQPGKSSRPRQGTKWDADEDTGHERRRLRCEARAEKGVKALTIVRFC